VIACNTASALALDAIEEAVSVPVLGVIRPGAAAAAASSKTKDVMVIATEATIASHAYAAACQANGLRAVEMACPLLVPLVEEGWVNHPVTAEVVRIYLAELLAEAKAAGQSPDTLVLGCTHYPIVQDAIRAAAGRNVAVIDSADQCAQDVARRLRFMDRLRPVSRGDGTARRGRMRCFVTDDPPRFAALAHEIMGEAVNRPTLVPIGRMARVDSTADARRIAS